MINKRALVVFGFIVLLFIAIGLKLFTIQVSNHEYYKLIAERQQNKPQNVKAERGLIKDINGDVLAYTKDNISFFVDTRMAYKYGTTKKIAEKFSEVMNRDKKYYIDLIERGEKNVCLEKKVPMDKALKLKSIVLPGLKYEEDFTRVYPYGSLASHLIGYVNYDFKGDAGIEKVFDVNLSGTEGKFVFERDVIGRIISVDERKSIPPKPGDNITLTINKTYQQIVEEELSNGIKKYGGESAIGIIMNPNTGEILALSNLPNYDPMNYKLYSDSDRRNRAVTDTYEPGSTMKSISLAVLLDLKLTNTEEVIETDNGKFVYKNVKISDTHEFEKLSVREIFEQSSNVGIAKLALRIPDDQFYKYLRDFGFGNPTSIDLPGETSGTLKKPNQYSAHSKMFMAHGYEISISPIQLISAYCALINGGNLMQPFLVKEITNNNGKVIQSFSPKKIRSVFSKKTSDMMKNLMIGVVEKGTGKAAQLENVLVGGKTGTAQQLVNKSYTSTRHNSSFIGFFPAQNPKVVCYVLVTAPQVGKYGGLVAAPIFKEIATRILENDLTIAPERQKIQRDQNSINQLFADLKSSTKTLSQSYLNVATKKNNSLSKRKFFNGTISTMPDLFNRSMRDAIAQLNELGLEYKVTGNGFVVEQSIKSGNSIMAGDTCFIKCEPSKKYNSIRVTK